MKIIAQNRAITPFSPIGKTKEHALSMYGKFPNLHSSGVGRERKKDYESAAPEIKRENTTVCAAKQNKSVNKSANITFGGFLIQKKL